MRSRGFRPTTCLVAGAVLAGCSGQELGAFEPRGSQAQALSWLFWVMVAAGAAVFVLVMVLLFRAARGRQIETEAEAAERRSTRLVLGGGVLLPVLVIVPLTVAMLAVGNRLAPRLGEAYEIRVIGHQYWWEVVYPDTGMVTANEIHIPVDTRVRVLLESADVIHSFWVPQLAGKVDLIPGQTTEIVFDADRPGRYLGQCAEFCGLQHSRMRFVVIAQPKEQFDQWLLEQGRPASPPQSEAGRRGQQVFDERGCAACHSVRGTDATGQLGPDLTHLMSRETLGSAIVPNNRAQLGGWVVDPQSLKPGSLMPPTPMNAEELLDLLEYLEGLE